MTLFTATIIVSIILIAKGLVWTLAPAFVEESHKRFYRNPLITILFFGSASIWFLFHLSQLGPADFGDYKHLLMILFGSVAVGSFLYVKDYLAVRGWAILVLLLAKVFLDAAYLQVPWTKVFLVSYVYLMILIALYFGTVPYKLKSFSNWIFKKPSRAKYFGLSFLAYGTLLSAIAFTY